MRILGFSKKWDKLNGIEFTTFRFPRKDRDWEAGEVVQVVFKPRSKEREILGSARINHKSSVGIMNITEEEAIKDGFLGCRDMEAWMIKTHGESKTWQPMNKLTLRWLGNEVV